jgi:5-methylcytosine-specific restriction endonuclease McrA
VSESELPPELLALLAAVQGKRARIVVDHILHHGFVTTEELETEYGYKHPPRAIRDVREQGIPIETFAVKNTQGRSIAAYRFADLKQIQEGRIGGLKSFSKAFKQHLIGQYGSQCAICSTPYEERYLQIDHRVPYTIAGDSDQRNLADYMLICGSCNRAKSWSCEHCANFQNMKNPALCTRCYWASPLDYDHIALRAIRRLDITWREDEVNQYDQLKASAESQNLPDFVKKILKDHLSDFS